MRASSVSNESPTALACTRLEAPRSRPIWSSMEPGRSRCRCSGAGGGERRPRPARVTVNEFLQSFSNPAIYAAGDVSATAGPPLTPVAGYEGSIVAANILEGNRRKPDYAGIPSVVFSIPNLASVGLGVEAARERKLKFRVNHQSTENWYSSRRTAEMHTGFKVLIEEGTGKILGAHLLGAQAEELANIFALAIRLGLGKSDLERAIFAYPSHASDLSYML